jgi:archaeal flagellin FlaB
MISFKHKDEGFTGLEAAIVLIAFVVVAAVFSYVVLGAGFFTTQKSQEVVHTGVQQASSTLEIAGNVYGTGAVGMVKYINFTISLAPGGTPVDVSKMIVTFSNETYTETMDKSPTYSVSSGKFAVNAIRGGNWDDLLEKGEQMDIGVMPKGGLYKNDQFTLEVKPIIGAALDIKRTAPASIQPVNILY